MELLFALDALSAPEYGIVCAVAVVAMLYASVGHAGATGYIAVLTLAGMAPIEVRPTALVLNVIVAAIGSVQFYRAGHFRWSLFAPVAAGSIPCAMLGGSLPLQPRTIELVVALVLFGVAVQLLIPQKLPREPEPNSDSDLKSFHKGFFQIFSSWKMTLVAAGIGLLSGCTGVGGGVFLTPILIALRKAPIKTIAAVTAPFILVNSLAGLAGSILGDQRVPPLAPTFMIAAILGGAIGSSLGATRLSAMAIRRLLAVVLGIASFKLFGHF